MGRPVGQSAHTRWLLLALVVLVTAAQARWLSLDASPMPHPNDPYQYAQRTLRFVDHFALGSLPSLLRQLSFEGRPPFYQLFSAPFVPLFGRSLDAMLSINLVFTALLLVAVYRVGRAVAGGWAGLLAAVIVAGSPPLLNLARVYRPHGPLAFFVVLSVGLLIRLLRDRSVAAAWWFGLSLGAGALFHPTFVYALAPPALVFVPYVVFFQRAPHRPADARALPRWLLDKLRDPVVYRGLLPAGAVALAAAVAWYAGPGSRLLLKASHLQSVTNHFVVGFKDVEPTFWWYALTAPAAITNAIAVLFVAGVFACLLERRAETVLLAGTVLAGYAIQSTSWNRSWWYVAPLIPIAAIAAATWIVEIRSRAVSATLAFVALAVSGFSFYYSTWSAGPVADAVAAALGSRPDSHACISRRAAAFCPGAPDPVGWNEDRIVAELLSAAPQCASGEKTCQVFPVTRSFLGPEPAEWPTIMSAFFAYHQLRVAPAARFQFEGYHKRRICGVAFAVRSDYLLVFGPYEGPGADCFGVWSRFLASPTPAFAEAYQVVGSVPLGDSRRARIVERRRELSPDEISEMRERLSAMMAAETRRARR